MTQLITLSQKLSSCDLVMVTVSEERYYCRFFSNGLYKDRMFITDSNLLQLISQLLKGGEMIGADGVAQLRERCATLPRH